MKRCTLLNPKFHNMLLCTDSSSGETTNEVPAYRVMICSWTSFALWGQPQERLCCPCFPSGGRALTDTRRQLEQQDWPPHPSVWKQKTQQHHSFCARLQSACVLHHMPLRLTWHPIGHHWLEWGIHPPSFVERSWLLVPELSMVSGICPL